MHIPVLKKEIIDILDPKPNENFIDCTIGEAGHTLALLEKNGPVGKVLGIDLDEKMLNRAKEIVLEKNFAERLILVCDNFRNVKKIAQVNNFDRVSGILVDLGMSSWHIEESGRGFSFRKEEPLDMRYNQDNPLTAKKIINDWEGKDIERILQEYGEEKLSKEITKRIIEKRKTKLLETTTELSELIKSCYARSRHYNQKINFSTRTFQALRIAVNDEIGNLEKFLEDAETVLLSKGKVVVVSFHSLEDRTIKRFFKKRVQEGFLKIINKKPIVPSRIEIFENPRSRSSKLRAAIKI